MDEVLGQAIATLFRQPFDLLLGRKTYDIFAALWPYAEEGANDIIAKEFNRATKYVATRTTPDLVGIGAIS